jgi:hypothetical protein
VVFSAVGPPIFQLFLHAQVTGSLFKRCNFMVSWVSLYMNLLISCCFHVQPLPCYELMASTRWIAINNTSEVLVAFLHSEVNRDLCYTARRVAPAFTIECFGYLLVGICCLPTMKASQRRILNWKFLWVTFQHKITGLQYHVIIKIFPSDLRSPRTNKISLWNACYDVEVCPLISFSMTESFW